MIGNNCNNCGGETERMGEAYCRECNNLISPTPLRLWLQNQQRRPHGRLAHTLIRLAMRMDDGTIWAPREASPEVNPVEIAPHEASRLP